jgi:hypothetical protein
VTGEEMGESFDRNIKQASLQTVTTHNARGDGGRGGGEGVQTKQSFETQTCAHPELELNSAALLKMKVWYPVAENFYDSL